ncbi:hypothetical protein B0T16DRAFT_386796 [Cercophora newfieldiana]|uniref:Mitotic apparatus protein p62 n=1 Tax=Cercophora newfieldiana TaxID=92897 RepID=A0AA40CW39_9PEZI|nr:hypothetical protein B0T16DRAFT_386796 [Cercophora newfieldiana]
MATSSRIIRVPRTDASEEGAFILGEVSPSGSKPLNLKIVATEGDAPYAIKLRHDRVDELRVSNSPCSPDEWEKILKAVLLGEGSVEGIKAGAEVEGSKSITITIRRRVAGINQRLGTITLSYKEDEAIELFEWCGNAMLANEKLRTQLAEETAKLADLETHVLHLRNQLDQLNLTKKADEDEMLEKFCLLLNEKKVKIREQQRLLSAAMVDPARVAAVVATRPPDTSAPTSSAPPSSARDGRGRVPKPSRPAKRKPRQAVSSDDSDDGFEKMDVDKKVPSPPSSRAIKAEPVEEDVNLDDSDSNSDEEQQTPGNDTETGSESDDDLDAPPTQSARSSQPPRRPPTAAEKGKGRATASPPSTAAKGKEKETLKMHPKKPAAVKKSLSPPPAAAAVARHRTATASPPPAPAEDSETESDDEL